VKCDDDDDVVDSHCGRHMGCDDEDDDSDCGRGVSATTTTTTTTVHDYVRCASTLTTTSTASSAVVDRDAGFNDGATMSTTPASMRAAMATRMCAQPVV
jgi:hypothetical protein